MYCDCYHSREMQYRMCITQASKQCPHQEKTVIFCTIFPPAFVSGLKSVSLVKRITKPIKQSSSDTCLHVNILFYQFPNRGGRKCCSGTPLMFSRPPTVSRLLPSISVPAHFGGRAGADINIYILGSRLQRGSFHRDPGC